MNLDDLNCRSGSQEDLESMYLLSRETLQEQVIQNFGGWDEAEQRAMYQRSTDPATHDLFFLSAELIAYWWVHRSNSELYLHRITVRPGFQNQGLGTQLLNRLLNEAKEQNLPVRLQVFPCNPAQRLYQRLGFREEKRTETHIHLVHLGESSPGTPPLPE